SAGGILVALACSWQSLAVQYHLRKLKGDANYFLEVLVQPGQGTRQEALRQYLALPDGRDRLFRAFLKEVLDSWVQVETQLRSSFESDSPHSLETSSRALLWIGPAGWPRLAGLENVAAHLHWVSSPQNWIANGGDVPFKGEDLPRVKAINAALIVLRD